jgi:hypothetical protein
MQPAASKGILLVGWLAFAQFAAGEETIDEKVRKFLDEFDENAVDVFKRGGFEDSESVFNYETDKTEAHRKEKEVAAAAYTKFRIENAKKAKEFKLDDIKDDLMKRQIKIIQKVGIALDKKDAKRLSELQSEMVKVWKADIPVWDAKKNGPHDTKKYNIDQFLKPFAESKDHKELQYIWGKYRETIAEKDMRQFYQEYATLMNKGATKDEFADAGAWWQWGYEMEGTLPEETRKVLMQIMPFYEKLHLYVRTKLQDANKGIPDAFKGLSNDKAIPAHVLGNMWAQTWGAQRVLDATWPYDPTTVGSIEVDAAMKAKGLKGEQLYHKADKFFASLGFDKMKTEFYDKSVFKDTGNMENCHATAYDFFKNNEVRVKHCGEATLDDLATAHHELGHCKYFLAYGKQPMILRTGASAGFHEAVGNILALSVSTPKHLEKIELLKDYKPSEKADINFLFKQAMENVVFMPFAYIIDRFRWDVFANETLTMDKWNDHWWKLKTTFQGLVPPTDYQKRPNKAFDPGAKFHVAKSVPYIRYFFAFVHQFQFYEAMCKKAKEEKPNDFPDLEKELYKCDFYGSKKAGNALKEMLSLGYSQPWPLAMKKLTGSAQPGKLDASSFFKYFKKLDDWLTEETNKIPNKCFGWERDSDYGDLPDGVTLPQPRCGKADQPKAATVQSLSIITVLMCLTAWVGMRLM